jgi:hypothetical protein
MIIRKGDRLVLAMSGDWLTQDRADHVKASIREAIPELAGVTILTGVSGMAIVRDDGCGPVEHGHDEPHNGHYGVRVGAANVMLPRCEACGSTDPGERGMPAGFRCDDPSGFHAAGPAQNPAYGADETRYGATGHPIDPVTCKNGLGDPCGPQDCVLEHSRPLVDGAGRIGAWKGGALVALRKVLAEVDAHEVATARGGMPYAETVEMLRRVATDMGLEL